MIEVPVDKKVGMLGTPKLFFRIVSIVVHSVTVVRLALGEINLRQFQIIKFVFPILSEEISPAVFKFDFGAREPDI